jgi:hypothetical protein
MSPNSNPDIPLLHPTISVQQTWSEWIIIRPHNCPELQDQSFPQNTVANILQSQD